MSKSLGFGPFHFRLPIAPGDRSDIDMLAVADGSALADWPADALVIKGMWKPGDQQPLMVRPIFPGTMRFLADDRKQIPELEVIDVDAKGTVTEAGFKTCKLVGKILIRVSPPDHIRAMKSSGTLEAIGVEPSWAIYGPVRLSEAFLGQTLLGRGKGFFQRPIRAVADNKEVLSTDPRWEALVLQSFVAGGLNPNLRCGAKLEEDDAAVMLMPELIVDKADNSFALGIALGWLRDVEKAVTWPLDDRVETIATVPFLRHVGKQLRESVLGAEKSSLVDQLFESEDSSKGWHERLRASLMAMGFGDVDGMMPIEAVLREFQIAASAPIAAAASSNAIAAAQLASRDFRDLVATANAARYDGPISGRANQATRRLIADWTRLGQRSPLIIAAFDGLDDSNLKVPQGTAAVHNDLWRRKETEDNRLRMFAADFSELPPGATLDESRLELLGYYGPYKVKKTGGPASLVPTPARHIAYAEFRPDRVGLKELLLAAAKRDDLLYPAASTFRVIRAVSEIECLGNLDQINAHDDAGLSYGPCHWSLALADKNAADKTELGGLAAYFHYLQNERATPGVDVFARQGFRPYLESSKDIVTAPREKSNGAFVWRLGLIDDRGRSRPMTTTDVLETVPSWRNFYRWVAIGRRDQVIGPATWNMALRRLHQLMTRPFPKEALTAHHQRSMPSPTMIDVFTSELAVALLMRWHVKAPNTVITTGKKNGKMVSFADAHIVNAYRAAVAKADSKKADLWQAALVEALRAEAKKVDSGFGSDFTAIIEQPWWNDPTKSRGHKIDRALTLLDPGHGSFALLGPDPGP